MTGLALTSVTVEIAGVVDTLGPLCIEANGRITAGLTRMGWCEHGEVEWSRGAMALGLVEHEASIVALARRVFGDAWGGQVFRVGEGT